MFKRNRKGLLWGLVLFTFVAVDHAAALSLSVISSSQSVSVGETVRVDVYLEDLLEGELTSYRVALDYDSPVLQFQSMVWGPNTLTGSEDVMDYDVGSEIREVLFSSGTTSNGPLDDILLGSIVFRADAVGECWFTFGAGEFYADGDGIPLFIDIFGTDYVTVTASVPGNTPVPEPATLVLLGAGLAGFSAARKKRKS